MPCKMGRARPGLTEATVLKAADGVVAGVPACGGVGAVCVGVAHRKRNREELVGAFTRES